MIFSDIQIKENWRNDDLIYDKLIFSLLANSSLLLESFPEKEEENIKYLYHTISSFLNI